MTKIAGSGSISQRYGFAEPDPDPDPAIFVIDLPKMHIIYIDKKSKRSHKAVGIKVFLTFFAR
jgi:hypothetical protein